MLKIGLTGGIASGKSTVCKLFASLNVPIIDADNVAHKLTEPEQSCFQQIIDCFGKQYLLRNGRLDRTKLRQLIFSDQTAKQQLEAILHPKIRQELVKQAEMAKHDYCILSIPLIIEAKMTDLVDRILVVDCELEIQKQRLSQRDHITADESENIIAQQCSRQQRLHSADDIIVNNITTHDLYNHVEQLDQLYRQLNQTESKSCQSRQTHGE